MNERKENVFDMICEISTVSISKQKKNDISIRDNDVFHAKNQIYLSFVKGCNILLMIGIQLFVVIIFQIFSYTIQSEVNLVDFNKRFLNEFVEVRSRLLSSIDPLFIANRNNLTLIYHGKETMIPIFSNIYDDLKSISHIPFTIYIILFNVKSKDHDLSSNIIIKLKSYLKDIRTIRKSLKLSHLTSHMQQIQFDIIDLSINYLRSLLKSKYLKQIKLKEFCLKSRQLFQINLDQVARAQLDLLHSIVNPWYTKLFNETERQTAKVIVAGPKPVRNGFFMTLYFNTLFGLNEQQSENNRVIFTENVLDQSTIKNILGSWLFDEYVGEAFYNDSLRLHRELMMDETVTYLKQLFTSQNIQNI